MPLSDESFVAPIRSRIMNLIDEQLPLDQWSAIDEKQNILIDEDNKVMYVPLTDNKFLKVELSIVD
jgi:hypothetical protein